MSDWKLTAKKTCQVCGETYWPAPREAQVKWEARKVCGKTCSGRVQSLYMTTRHANR
jgi:hypothetical protein